MVVHWRSSALKQGRWYEYLLRFALGGLATVLAGCVADIWGPETGGLFLAMPVIFCASASLIERHERKRKEKRGLKGSARGRNAAALDAAGGTLGGLALTAFAVIVWRLAKEIAEGSLVLAALGWFTISIALWQAWPRVRRHTMNASDTSALL